MSLNPIQDTTLPKEAKIQGEAIAEKVSSLITQQGVNNNQPKCKSCGKELGYGFLKEYPDATVCSSRKCYYKDLANTRPEYASMIAQIPKKYREASFVDDIQPEIKKCFKNAIVGSDQVFLTGTQGIGKTYLAAAIANSALAWHATDTGYDVIWRRSTDLILELQGTFNGRNDTAALINKFKRAGLLIIDDFGAERLSDWSVSVIYAILAERIDEIRPTIVTSNLDLDQINDFEPRIASRLAEFTTAELGNIDRRLSNDAR